MALATGSFKKIADKLLFVSEPGPEMFGNPSNPANNPNWSNKNWLKSRFHFSFAEYHDGRNRNFGVLRVLNDDIVQPSRGFGTHPHRDMEICTYIVNGALTHKDSMGSQETLGRGGVQFMTAGRGVTHSERNEDGSTPLRLLQMWIVPRHNGLKPNYGSSVGNDAARANQWAHLVSDVNNGSAKTPVKLNQDANVFVAEIDAGKELPFEIKEGRQAYVVNIEGSTIFSSDGHPAETLEQYDAAEVRGPMMLGITPTSGASTEAPGAAAAATKALTKSHVLVIEMALSHNDGRFM